MILEPGTKLHVITRRGFEDDIRRHFAGEVMRATDTTALVRGYTFVLSTSRNEYVRRPDRRTRIISLIDAANIINVIPRDANLETMIYKYTEAQRLVVTDGGSFQLDINEFGSGR